MTVYVPSKEFDTSQRFYEALGFTITEAWGGNVDCTFGSSTFRLQNAFVKDWAHNFMLQFYVDDAQAWYDFVKPIVDGGDFGEAKVESPRRFDGVLITHVHDPSGVLLIFIQL